MVLFPLRRRSSASGNPRAVVQCYSLFDRFFPPCGLLDYTEGLYHGDEQLPLEVAQQNQLQYVLDEAGCSAGSRILEIGCGNGTLLEAATRRGGQAVGITISPEQVARCRGRNLDARLLNYLELDDAWAGQFDAVIANGPIEHFVQPRDAAADRSDAIYRQLFDICHRMIDPNSGVRRLVTTTIHFIRRPAPENLLKSPLAFLRGSDDFHWAMLARSFGGWYPVPGQFDAVPRGVFAAVRLTDGTHDYHLTSEEWLRRIRAVLPTLKGCRLLLGAVPFGLRHPVKCATMFACMLGSESWNWQFRGSSPPTQLLRHTWAYCD